MLFASCHFVESYNKTIISFCSQYSIRIVLTSRITPPPDEPLMTVRTILAVFCYDRGMKKITRPSAYTIVAFIIIGLLLVAQFVFIFAMVNEMSRQNRERVWDTHLIYACYNNDIHPCDDSGVSKWNESNPDKAITESYLRTE